MTTPSMTMIYVDSPEKAPNFIASCWELNLSSSLPPLPYLS